MQFNFTISDVKMHKIDVLLSGAVFYNTGILITPYKDSGANPYRAIRINTFEQGRDRLFMSICKDKNGQITGIPAMIKDVI